eukprot:m.234702 g.234702  ORF g.234702 m.234702 type:complete len:779 (+) comp19729_c0_seq1:152-2488(+)
MAHVILESELNALTRQINLRLAEDEDVAARLPLDPPAKLFEEVTDGLLLSKLIAVVKPDAINTSVLHRPPMRTQYQAVENQNLCIDAARKMGCVITNIGALDIMRNQENHTEHLVLGLLWQIVKFALMSRLTIHLHPELIRLVGPGEDLARFLQLPPEDVLLRWVNYHIERAGLSRKMTNFGSDVMDSTIYATLLHALDPSQCAAPETILAVQNLTTRAEKVLAGAAALGCLEYVTPPDVVAGNSKLNLAFIANLFNKHPGIQLPSEEELRMLTQSGAQLRTSLLSAQGSVAALQSDLARVASQNTDLARKLSDAEQEKTGLLSSRSTLEASLAAAQKENRELHDLLFQTGSQSKQEVSDLTARLAAVTSELEAAKQSTATAAEEHQQNVQQLNAAIATLKDQLANTRLQTARSIDVLTGETAQLTHKLEETEARLAAATSRERDYEAEIARLKARIAELEESLARVTAERDAALRDLASLREANERGSSAYKELKTRHHDAEAALVAARLDIAEKSNALAAAKKSIEEKEWALFSAERDRDDTQAQLAKLAAKLKEQTAEYEKRFDDLTAAMRDLETKRGEWETKATRAEGRAGALEVKCATQLTMIDHLSGQKYRSDTFITHLKRLSSSYSNPKKLTAALYDDTSADRFERLAGLDAPSVMGVVRAVVERKEAKPFKGILKDNFLFLYKPDKAGEPQEVFRVDDCTIVSINTADQFCLDLTLIHPAPHTLRLEFADPAHLAAWEKMLQAAADWWTDNKSNRDPMSRGIVRSPTNPF